MEFMAGLALTVFWVHLLIMAAAAVLDLRRTLGEYAAQRRQGFVRARVVAAGGPDEVLAEHRIEQRGRSKGDGKIHFHDRDHSSQVHGGRIRLEDGTELDVEAGEVWPDPNLVRANAAPGGTAAFEEAYGLAVKAKGWLRTVVTPVRVGDDIWYATGEGGLAILAQRSPASWFRQRTLLVILAVILGLAIGGGLTVAALWPPLFGTIGKIGAFAMLVYFNLAQDAGRVINEYVRPPSRAYLRGAWKQL